MQDIDNHLSPNNMFCNYCRKILYVYDAAPRVVKHSKLVRFEKDMVKPLQCYEDMAMFRSVGYDTIRNIKK